MAAALSGSASWLNLVGDSTHLGQPFAHGQDVMMSRILSQTCSTIDVAQLADAHPARVVVQQEDLWVTGVRVSQVRRPHEVGWVAHREHGEGIHPHVLECGESAR